MGCVFPASAGMIPLTTVLAPGLQGVPRIRGDDPQDANAALIAR